MLINLEQRTQAWYDWRNGLDLPDASPRITATAASVIMGNSPFQTASQLWEQMVGLRPPTETNAAMQIGVDYEDKALAKLMEMTGVEFYAMCCTAEDLPIAGASLDGINDVGDIIAEIKVPGQKTIEMAQNGVVPPHYYDQIQWQLYCSGAVNCLYFVYDWRNDVGYVNQVDRNEVRIAEMRVAAIRFRQCVIERTPPGGFDLEFEATLLAGLMRDMAELEIRVQAARNAVTKAFEATGLPEARSGGLVIAKVAAKAGSTSWKKVAALMGTPTPEQLAQCVGAGTEASYRIELAGARTKKKAGEEVGGEAGEESTEVQGETPVEQTVDGVAA